MSHSSCARSDGPSHHGSKTNETEMMTPHTHTHREKGWTGRCWLVGGDQNDEGCGLGSCGFPSPRHGAWPHPDAGRIPAPASHVNTTSLKHACTHCFQYFLFLSHFPEINKRQKESCLFHVLRVRSTIRRTCLFPAATGKVNGCKFKVLIFIGLLVLQRS